MVLLRSFALVIVGGSSLAMGACPPSEAPTAPSEEPAAPAPEEALPPAPPAEVENPHAPKPGTPRKAEVFEVKAEPAGLAVEDHEELEGPFEAPSDVTSSCLDCHDEAAAEVMKTSHWTWTLKQGGEQRGKRNAINNFCISLPGNWPRCTSCHAGYGWKDDTFDFSDQTKVDCLVCHERSGGHYVKPGPAAGMPAGYTGVAALDKDAPDLAEIARTVGKPTRANCLACHAYGGGGENVKHGDLEPALRAASRDFDVHMGVDGVDMSCQHCHETKAHGLRGNAMAVSPEGDARLDCVHCHTDRPHTSNRASSFSDRLNQHAKRIACQTCHIPYYAKDKPTKLRWDWSTAGKDLPEGKDQYGKPTYHKKKGSFVWGKDVIPEYAWYDGTATSHRIGDTIDPSKPVALARPNGRRSNPDARIFPFKVHRGKQPYDVVNRTMITPKLFPSGPDADEAFWESFDWGRAAAAGMAASGRPYSGQLGFVDTVMYWRLNHEVVPARDALRCGACHAPEGRLDWKALGYDGDPHLPERRTK